MSACCQFVSHLWSLIAHHSGHRPKVTQEALANLTLYSNRSPSREGRANQQPKGTMTKLIIFALVLLTVLAVAAPALARSSWS